MKLLEWFFGMKKDGQYIKPFKITRNKLELNDYKEINTPQVVDEDMGGSGHWDKYRENMFITEIDEEHANEKRTNALKPMNVLVTCKFTIKV